MPVRTAEAEWKRSFTTDQKPLRIRPVTPETCKYSISATARGAASTIACSTKNASALIQSSGESTLAGP